jgi:hypothetical protein
MFSLGIRRDTPGNVSATRQQVKCPRISANGALSIGGIVFGAAVAAAVSAVM